MSPINDDSIIYARRQPTDRNIGSVYYKDLEGFHWGMITGGTGIRTSNLHLFAYMQCDKVIDGEISHSGIHGPCPHRIKVCILKTDNPETFKDLELQYKKAEYGYIQINKAKPYKVEKDGSEIITALENDLPHVSVSKKGNVYLINPRKIKELVNSGSNATIAQRSKRLRKYVESHIDRTKFERMERGNRLVFVKKK
jgi:ribosomal protein L17